MCRMMAAVGKMPGREALEEFRGLAAHGDVLPGNTCGHGDGWGFAAYRGGAMDFFEKSGKSAAEDVRFTQAADDIQDMQPDILIAHLRKASVGAIDDVNAHPFQRDGIAFCHNGGVKESERIPIFGLEPTGGTDSERFFLSIVGRLQNGEASSLREAAEQAIRFVHENLPYSSLSFLLTDGREVLVWRDYRTDLRPGESEPPKNFEIYPEYYTLYRSEAANAVSSQPLTAMADDWALIENRTMLTLRADG